MNRGDVCITGIGAATPLGSSYEEIAAGLLAGRSGVRPVTRFGVADQAAKIAATVEEVPPCTTCGPGGGAELSSVERLTLYCAEHALRDAGWWDRRHDTRIGLVLGTATEWNGAWEMDFLQGGAKISSPHADTESMVQRVSRRLQLSGPTLSLSAACASSNYALALARRWLKLGWVDVCLAGGADMGVTPTLLASFGNLRTLSRRNDDPTAASRPFDSERDGFVLGEGGVLFVLENEAAARQRSAPIRAGVAGFGATSDAFHMVIPSSDPAPAMAAMRQALADAHACPDQIGYVNAHATSTPIGDVAETRALAGVFGPAIDKVPVSSTKSMVGHLLTAAAAFEALACVVALERQALPPTINLHKPDPECRLVHVPNHAQQRPVRLAMSNSFGFGGSNTCLILRSA